MVVVERLDEIAGNEFDVIEFCKIEDMRFQEHGRRDVEFLTDIRKVIEKSGIGEAFRFFVDELFFDFSVCDEFCPDFHNIIIQETQKKVNGKE